MIILNRLYMSCTCSYQCDLSTTCILGVAVYIDDPFEVITNNSLETYSVQQKLVSTIVDLVVV